MNTILKQFLSMSCFGGLMILLLLLCTRIFRQKISRQWQYYVWLIVILRLLLPFEPEINLSGEILQIADETLSRTLRPAQEYLTKRAGLPEASDEKIDETMQAADSTANQEEADNRAADGASNQENTASRLPAISQTQREHPITDSPQTAGLAPPTKTITATVTRLLLYTASTLKPHLWLIWLTATLLLFQKKLTAYRSFLRYLRSGATPVSDTALLDSLAVIAEAAGIKKPVELWIHPLISSPLLIGFFHPCIVLPDAGMSEDTFRYTALHELMHYRRRDIFYKWLVQIAVCLHWFNPLVHVMSREITKACEFSCDEAVLKHIGTDHAQGYGKTLLDAMAATAGQMENIGAVTLSENKQLLKERLGAIMTFKKRSTGVRLLTGVLTLCIGASAALIGVYPVSAKTSKADGAQQSAESKKGTSSTKTEKKSAASAEAERYYKAESLPLFQSVFYTLSEAEQKYWLNRIYADDEVAFFSIAMNALNDDSPLIAKFAKKAYKDGKTAFFSILADYMDKKTLEKWADRALADGDITFLSILAGKLGQDDKKDALEEKWAKQQMAEYKKYGVTMKGKNYYYKGKLVRIFLDRRKTFAAYTLNINPKGTVDIKVVRDKKDNIKKVSYMTKAEVKEILGEDAAFQQLDSLDDLDDLDDLDSLDDLDDLDGLENLDDLDDLDGLENLDDLDDLDGLENLDDLDSPDNLDGSRKLTIPVNISRIKDGAFIWLGTFKLSKGDRICYNVSAKTGERLDVGFAKPGQPNPQTTYMTVSNRRTDGELKIKSGVMKWGNALTSGSYRLFIHTKGSDVTKVKGSITIVKAK